MAPNRKKKKPATNTRGYATTSVASKAKATVDDDADTASIDTVQEQYPVAEAVPGNSSISLKSAIALADLSPEELEKQLEESELQIWLEKHGEKVKKEVTRQIAKLHTEKRLLRAQASPLNSSSWLLQDSMLRISDNIELHSSNEPSPSVSRLNSSKFNVLEEDLCMKLWSLQRTLSILGLSGETVDGLLRRLCQHEQLLHNDTFTSSKDYLWGLEICLDWLAQSSETKELPEYDSYPTEVSETRFRATPSSTESPETCTGESSKAPHGRPSALKHEGTDQDENGELAPESDSESNSDVEPSKILERYQMLQTRLYRIQPELTDTEAWRRNSKQKSKSSKEAMQIKDPRAGILRKKIRKIESDLLFNRDEARETWAATRIQLVREDADRRKLDLASEPENLQVVPQKSSLTDATVQNPMNEDQGNDVSMALGDFFSSLPSVTMDETTGMSSLISADGTAEIRDFGKWTGISPRRVFEEACRARDSSSRVSYNHVPTSPFSHKHSLSVTWSRDQEVAQTSPIPTVLCNADSRSVKVNMISISNPTSIQSEAYISTIALYIIFAASPKDEKTYLRLPPVWRDFWAELSEARKAHVNAADRDELRKIRHMVEEELREGAKEHSSGEKVEVSSKRADLNAELHIEIVVPEPNEMSRDSLVALWHSKSSAPSYIQMLKTRTKLPIWAYRDELLDAIQRHQVVIVCGETGCGKSTQVPAFILEHSLSYGQPCKIYCTQPRRISAISLARRVNEELGERKNDVGTSRSLVGYAIRLESRMTAQTRLVYATTGIVMRILEGSSDLGGITHLILDEVHERTIDSDFLLIVLRKLMIKRPDLKVILMSATVNAEQFSRYLDDAPVMNVPGRTYPVETKYLEDAVEFTQYVVSGDYGQADPDDDREDRMGDVSAPQGDLSSYSSRTRNTLGRLDEYRIEYDLVTKLLEAIATQDAFIDYSKAILVFLPGIAEIRRLNDMLLGHRSFSRGWCIYPLHSTIATDEQEQAFNVPPPGIRKIVLATNIAETGITIPDVTCVIDAGKHKEMRFDERRQLSRLIESFISRANAKQRRGRAGRVQNGICFHLFTKARHDQLMAEQQTPEMLRLSLQDLVLRVKICKLGSIEETLAEALDPPMARNVRRAIDSLIDVKALTTSEELTSLGRQLAKLPLDVFLGKLILLGSIFRCLDSTLTIAAILSSKSPFSAPVNARTQADIARLAFKKGDSDPMTVYNAYCAWRRVCKDNSTTEFQFCRKNYLSPQALSNIEDLKGQLATSLADAGFLVLNDSEKAALNRTRTYMRQRQFTEIPEAYDVNNGVEKVVASVIAWSFYPKLLVKDGKGWRNAASNQSVSLSPTSVNKGGGKNLKYVSFYHIMQSANRFYNAHETTAVEDFAIALLCGEADFKMYSGIIIIDGNRLRFSTTSWRAMYVIKALRSHLREIMNQSFRNPGRLLTSQQRSWFDIWQKLFSQEFKDKSL